MRLSIALLTIVTTAASASPSRACCLTDWLYGRTAAPVVVGYAPYAAGYAPITATPIATSPYAAAYAPIPVTTAPVQSTSVLRPAWNAAPVLSSGAYQAQRPTYYDNPSVYTGLPVTGNVQTTYRLPLRGTVPTNSYMGAVNSYSSTYSAGYAAAQVNTQAPGLPMQVTTPTGSPVTALPATPVAPLYPATQPSRGLGRFFGSLFGTSYRSSYYRAPITYYRPVTSIDPVSGTTVTVQQPCSSYVQQLQRTPYGSLQPALAPPSSGCQTPNNDYCNTTGSYPIGSNAPSAPYSMAPSSIAPPSIAPLSGVGQVGAVGQPNQMTVPIPSTAPAAGGSTYYGQPGPAPNLSPLTGAPPSLSPFNSAPAPSLPPASAPSQSSQGAGDAAPVDQPRLENYPPASLQPEPDQAPNESPRSYWELQDADDSTALIRPSVRQIAPQRDPVSLGGTGATPIRAPEDYVSPFRRPTVEAPTTPVTQETFEAPPLPTRSYDSSDATSVANRISVPIRDAGLIRSRSTRQAIPAKRDSTWYTIQP